LNAVFFVFVFFEKIQTKSLLRLLPAFFPVA